MIKVIGFDLSGTLISEEKYFKEADKIDEALLIKYNIPVDPKKFNKIVYEVLKEYELLLDFEATKPTKFYEMCFDKLGIKVEKEKMEKMQEELDNIYANYVELNEGAIEILSKLKEKYKLVLITDTMERRVNLILNRFNLKEYFDEIVTPEMYGKKKNLNSLKKIIEKFGISPREFVIVGDSTKNDITPAKKLDAYYIKVGNVKPGEIFKWYARNLYEIPKLVDAINTINE